VIEGNLGTFRITVLAGFDQLLSLAQRRSIDQKAFCSSGVGSKKSRDILSVYFHLKLT
jgi:hypothetical protein